MKTYYICTWYEIKINTYNYKILNALLVFSNEQLKFLDWSLNLIIIYDFLKKKYIYEFKTV